MAENNLNGGPKPFVPLGFSQKLKKIGQLWKGLYGEIGIGHVIIYTEIIKIYGALKVLGSLDFSMSMSC